MRGMGWDEMQAKRSRKAKSLGAVRQGNSDNKGQAPEVDQVSEIGKVVTKSSSGIRVIK
jgi:nucleotidyltransferase/DNA polymerase involved in DNA repair